MAAANTRTPLYSVTEINLVPQDHTASESRLLNPVVFLALFTVAAAALRLFRLGSKSLWIDEAASVALARMPWRHYAWVWWRQEGNMTAYYLLLRPWLHLGQSEAWIRLLSVLFGIAAIPVMFLLARRLVKTPTALLASGLLTVSPTHIYYSQEARSYSLTIFLVLLVSFFFVRAVQENRRRDWIWWTALGALAVYAHYFAVLVLVAQAASVLLLRPGKVHWKPLLAGSATIFVLALPGIIFVVLRGGTLNLPWIPYPGLKEIVHLWMFLGGSGVKFALYLVLWTAGVVGTVNIWRHEGRSIATWERGLVVLWAVLPVLITVAASQRHSVFAQKYLLICLPATILLASIGADGLRMKNVGVALVIVLCVFSLGTGIRAAYKPREDWRGATQAILSHAQPGDAIVFYPFYSRVAFDYYRRRNDSPTPDLRVYAPEFYGTGEGEQALRQELGAPGQGFNRVWVVLLGPEATAGDLKQQDPLTAAALQARFGAPVVWQFKDIAVAEFQR